MRAREGEAEAQGWAKLIEDDRSSLEKTIYEKTIYENATRERYGQNDGKKSYGVREHNGSGMCFKDNEFEAQLDWDMEKLIFGSKKTTIEYIEKSRNKTPKP